MHLCIGMFYYFRYIVPLVYTLVDKLPISLFGAADKDGIVMEYVRLGRLKRSSLKFSLFRSLV